MESCRRLDQGPKLSFAPAAWWLVGLGHLGQAYSWVLSWLDYQEPTQVQVVLQDTDETTLANHSTGLLTTANPNAVLKTRVVAEALDRVGFDTRIIERRLTDRFRVEAADVHVALFGVDNLATRRLTSNVGWRLAIDAGLGSGSNDYSSMLLRRFPGKQASHEVTARTQPPGQQAGIPHSPAFDDLARRTDACGLAELANKAVGAAFVGCVAACLAIAEAVRELHGGTGYDVVAANLMTVSPITAPATKISDVICSPLRRAE